MEPLPLSASTRRLVANLATLERQPSAAGHAFHVASLGAGFYFAYEQIRNAAEYRDHHLLLRNAIERYLRRDVNLRHYDPQATDLITELTQAGYLKNDSVPLSVLERIDTLLANCSTIYTQLISGRKTDARTADKWLYQYASVQIENLVVPGSKVGVVMQYAYEHYLSAVDAKASAKTTADNQEYRIALFCAVQRTLFKSNLATTRYHCVTVSLGELEKAPLAHIVELNHLIDRYFQAPMTNRLCRLISHYGAPMRIITQFVLDTGGEAKGLFEPGRVNVTNRLKSLTQTAYATTEKALNARIARTILFILITKTLIGVSIEIPYDLAVVDAISWVPLLINIFFPLLYMITIGSRIATPSRQNTQVVADWADRILYDTGQPVVYKPKRRIKSKSTNAIFNFVYAVGFIGSITLVIWALHQLNFNLVNGTIFFIFFSAVSFLGFRLRQLAHELQLIDEHAGLIQALIDFLANPFVRVGHYISDTYAKANIVTFVLDLAIEMPLKTSLRFVRQWISFMRDKQEEL